MIVLTWLAACSGPEPMEDNSLEASQASSAEEAREASGVAAVTAGEGEGDWVVTVGGIAFDWHSASRAPLLDLDGRSVRIEIDEAWFGPGSARILEDDAPVLVVSTGDGSEAFGRPVWSMGSPIGKGEIINESDEATRVLFHEVVVRTDDGEVVLLPGEPTAVVLDGATYRATVLAAYTIDRKPMGPVPGCGPSDLLSIELFRTEAAETEPPLVRPAGRLAPLSSCG